MLTFRVELLIDGLLSRISGFGFLQNRDGRDEARNFDFTVVLTSIRGQLCRPMSTVSFFFCFTTTSLFLGQ